jgi:hypothetical protein
MYGRFGQPRLHRRRGRMVADGGQHSGGQRQPAARQASAEQLPGPCQAGQQRAHRTTELGRGLLVRSAFEVAQDEGLPAFRREPIYLRVEDGP